MAEIGPTLRDARIRARIDMSEVETQTKIRAKYLRAIENEEWDLLPGPVYIKSFLRTYGDYLGLDSRMLVEEFKQRYERPHDQEMAPPIASLERERERERMPRPALPP
jgi:cytoskeletal protein RodZ